MHQISASVNFADGLCWQTGIPCLKSVSNSKSNPNIHYSIFYKEPGMTELQHPRHNLIHHKTARRPLHGRPGFEMVFA
jgi:hypothetical protein